MGFCSSKSCLPWAELGAPTQRSNPQLPISRNNGLFSPFFFVGGHNWSVLKESRISSRPCEKPELSEGCFKKVSPFFLTVNYKGKRVSLFPDVYLKGGGARLTTTSLTLLLVRENPSAWSSGWFSGPWPKRKRGKTTFFA